MGKNFELHAHYPKKFCAARAYSHDDHEIGVVCFIFCGESVTKRGDVDATVKQSEIKRVLLAVAQRSSQYSCILIECV